LYKRRLIPVLYLKDGWMVRSQTFSLHQVIGDPVSHVVRMAQWQVDELIVLDIGESASSFEHHRADYRTKPVKSLQEFIALIAVECNMPLTFGGRIRSVDDIRARIQNGADKVTVNTMLREAPQEVTAAAQQFGSQAIVASIDYRIVDGRAEAFTDHAETAVGDAVDWARRAADLGVGEILLNSIDRDGTAKGYDLATIETVSQAVSIPVIACGGAGHQRHFLEVLQKTSASAVAAGNIFHFKENAYPLAKTFLKQTLADIR
jgi:imidazole glycerol-phosphate synthase subunit HisF